MPDPKKQFPALDSLNLDEWAEGEADFEGNRLIVQLCTGAMPLVGHPDYPNCIRVGVPINEPDEEGLTTDEEAETLYELEDQLNESLTENYEAIAVLVLTVEGMREYVFYSRDLQATLAKVAQINESFESHDFEAVPEQDPEWEFFQNFTAEDDDEDEEDEDDEDGEEDPDEKDDEGEK